MHTCADCHHHPHSGRPCAAVTITGPASSKGRPILDDTGEMVGYEHIGRVETPCPCTEYRPEVNGAATA